MKAAPVIGAWLAGPLALGAVLLIAQQRAPAPTAHFHGARFVAVGSSLSAHGLAESASGAETFSPNGEPTWRIGIALAREDQLTALANAAAKEHVRLAVIEANPLISGLAFDAQARCNQPAGTLRRAAKAAQLGVIDALRRLFGARGEDEGMGEPKGLDQPQRINTALLRSSYPLNIHAPCDEAALRGAIDAIRAQGGRAVLALPPRSPIGEAKLGPQQSAALLAEAEALSRRLEAPLFVPAGPWRNDEFTDHGHLNRQGRARYTAALKVWLEQTR